MKNCKKVLSVLLALLLLSGAFTIIASASPDHGLDDSWVYLNPSAEGLSEGDWYFDTEGPSYYYRDGLALARCGVLYDQLENAEDIAAVDAEFADSIDLFAFPYWYYDPTEKTLKNFRYADDDTEFATIDGRYRFFSEATHFFTAPRQYDPSYNGIHLSVLPKSTEGSNNGDRYFDVAAMAETVWPDIAEGSEEQITSLFRDGTIYIDVSAGVYRTYCKVVDEDDTVYHGYIFGRICDCVFENCIKQYNAPDQPGDDGSADSGTDLQIFKSILTFFQKIVDFLKRIFKSLLNH